MISATQNTTSGAQEKPRYYFPEDNLGCTRTGETKKSCSVDNFSHGNILLNPKPKTHKFRADDTWYYASKPTDTATPKQSSPF